MQILLPAKCRSRSYLPCSNPDIFQPFEPPYFAKKMFGSVQIAVLLPIKWQILNPCALSLFEEFLADLESYRLLARHRHDSHVMDTISHLLRLLWLSTAACSQCQRSVTFSTSQTVQVKKIPSCLCSRGDGFFCQSCVLVFICRQIIRHLWH